MPITERDLRLHFSSAGATRKSFGERATAPVPFRPRRSHTFTHPFEELALFERKNPGNPAWFAGLLNGTFEVEVEPTGGWDIIEIHLHTENGFGAGKTFAVSRDEDRDFFNLLHDRLTQKYAPNMFEEIGEQMSDHGLRLEW